MTNTTFGEALARVAADRPDDPAVTCGDRRMTWQQLESASNQLARAYAEAGVERGSFVSIGLENSPDFFVAAYATWKLGAVPQPLSHRITAAELEAILRIVEPAGVVGLPAAPGRCVLPSSATDRSSEPLPPVVSPAWKAPTSGGSTGRPKVIVSETPAIVEQLRGFAALSRIPSSGAIVVPGPLHHNAPFLFAAVGLQTGSHVVLRPKFDAEQLLADIERHRASWSYVVPTMMQRIWRLPEPTRRRYDLSSLHHVVHMAAPCPAWLKREWIGWLGADRITEVYSATEGLAATRIDGDEWLAHPGSVGRPVVGEIRITDDDGREVGPDRTGRVWLRAGAGAPSGYRYLGADAVVLEGGWECVGDLGRVDEDGYLYLTDRDGDMINVGGCNVYPAEIEAALDEHPAVLASCVIGLPHEDLGAAPHAIVHALRPLPEAELAAFLRDRLSAYKLPRSFEFTDRPVRDDAGKVRRSALRADRMPQGPPVPA